VEGMAAIIASLVAKPDCGLPGKPDSKSRALASIKPVYRGLAGKSRLQLNMQREQFHDLLTRAAGVCERRELIIFGSQTVHALTGAPPAEVLLSVECDIWLYEEPEVASRLGTELGKDSSHAKTAGVYADPLPPDLPMVPAGWQQRLVTYRIGEVTARCLEIHDLIVTKLAAGRLKAYEFIAAVLMAKLALADEVVHRIRTFRDPHLEAMLLARLRIATEATDVRL
jgi:hypothetical protein